MDTFSEALLSGKTDKIPDSFDWFAPLLGDWDCDYFDEYVKGRKRHVKGEWIFRRVLEGKVLDEESTYWIFSDITDNSFRWEYVINKQGGSRELVCEIIGKRIN